MARTQDAVLLTVVTCPGPRAEKVRFYALLSRYMAQRCGLSPNDLVVSLVENSKSDWSFGKAVLSS